MGPPPVVTGVSPKEGPPGTRVTIRGEFLGTSAVDLVGKPEKLIPVHLINEIERLRVRK